MKSREHGIINDSIFWLNEIKKALFKGTSIYNENPKEMEVVLAYCKVALKEKLERDNPKPIAKNQLKKHIGKPVYFVVNVKGWEYQSGAISFKDWHILRKNDFEIGDDNSLVINGGKHKGVRLRYADYGKWLPYLFELNED